nr:hypothetical protein [Rhizobium sp. P32RR-XVIII]
MGISLQIRKVVRARFENHHPSRITDEFSQVNRKIADVGTDFDNRIASLYKLREPLHDMPLAPLSFEPISAMLIGVQAQRNIRPPMMLNNDIARPQRSKHIERNPPEKAVSG